MFPLGGGGSEIRSLCRFPPEKRTGLEIDLVIWARQNMISLIKEEGKFCRLAAASVTVTV